MRSAGVLASLSVLLTFGVAALLSTYNEPLYQVSVQEDEYLEWASFWGFALAAWIYFVTALHRFRSRRQLPWFAFGLVLFCLLVAMEEISWGQRLFGYRAPDFFLEENYQQEFNIHNVVDTGARKFVLQLILLGYGVILSAASLWPPLRHWFERLRIDVPSPLLIPAFLAMFVVYAWYPWSHTGEWVEFTMACGFAYAALFERRTTVAGMGGSATRDVLLLFASIWLLAALTVTSTRAIHASDPDRIEAARLEIAALAEDFATAHVHTRCGIHKRLYTFMLEYQQPYLVEGEFAKLLNNRGEDKRAEYLLDPWNSAYWIRHKCSGGRESKFVYSFGADRRRNSSDWEIVGDDIGAYLERRR